MTRAIFLLCVLCVSPVACSALSECDANAGECDAKDQNVLLQGRVRVEPEKSQLKAEAAGNAEEGIVGEEEGQPDDNEEDDEDEEGEALLEEDDDEEDDEKDVDHAVSGDKKAARRACRKACKTEMRSKRPAVKKECKAKADSRQGRRQCIRGEMSKLRKACKAKCSSFLDESDEMAEMEDPVRGYLMVVNNSCHSSGNIRVSSASQCAAKAYTQCATKDYMQSKNGRYCYCCRKGGNRYFSTYYNLYRAYKGTPPATTTTTTTTPDAANAPHGLVVSKGFTCGRTYKYFNGGNINSDFCAMMTLATPGCGKEFQYAAAHPNYGCACCRPGGASGGYLNAVYDIYLAYKGAVPPSTTTTTTITPSPEDRTHGLLIAKGRYCQRTFKHFRVTNEELCAKFTLNTKGCAKEFARYPTQPTWGCACCSPSQALPGTLNTQANIYIAYKGTTPPSTTTTTTTTPDAANAPHGMIVARNVTCKRTYKYFPVQNPDTCAGLVLATRSCAKEFSFSASYPGWGCRCCQKGNSYGGYPSAYYQLYLAYKGTTPPSTTTTTTTTPDAANAPHGHLKKGQSMCYNQYKHFRWARNADTCAMLTLMEPKCAKEFHFSPKYTAWGCACCLYSNTRYRSNSYYNVYTAYKGTCVPGSPCDTTTATTTTTTTIVTTTTTVDAVANAPHGLLVSHGYSCKGYYKGFRGPNNGRNTTVEFCAKMTLATRGCGKEFQFSAKHPSYGCTCCRPGQGSGGWVSPIYDIYLAYRGTVPPATTTTTTTTPTPAERTHGLLIAKQRYCQRTFKHFRVTTAELCAKLTLTTKGCGKEFARYPAHPTWGCACCAPNQWAPGSLVASANIYIAYKGTTPPATTTTTTTTPDAANAPHGMIVARNTSCKRGYKYFPVQNPDTCAGLVLADGRCAKEFQFSPWNTAWGCRCCRKGESYGGSHSQYNHLYLAYKGTTPPSTTTTTTTTPDAANAPHGHLKKTGHSCYRAYKRFYAKNADTCAMMTLMHLGKSKCANDFYFSPKNPQYGCYCCSYSNTQYRSNNYYNVYTAYKGTCPPGSPCDTTTAAPATTTTTPAPCAHGQQWRFGSLGQSCDTVCGRSACDLASIRNIAYDKKKFKAVAEKLGFWSAANSWGHSSGWDEFPGTLDWMHGRKFGFYNDTYKTTTCEASHIKVRRLCSCCTEATSTSTAAPTPAPTTPAPTTPAPTTPAPTTPAPTTPAPTTPAPSPATTPAPMPAPAPAPAPPVPAPAQPVPTPDPRVDELAKSVDSVQKDLGTVKSDVKKILESFEGDGDGDGDGPLD